MPAVPIAAGEWPERMRWERELRRLLIAQGFFEAVTLSFASQRTNALFPGIGVEGAAVRLANPVNQDEPELRRSLLPGLLATWRTNRNQGAKGLAAFSIGRVFRRADATREGWRLAGLLAGELPRHGLGAPPQAEFADAKGTVEALFERLLLGDRVRWERYAEPPFHPGMSAAPRCGDAVVGVVGALHPNVEFELNLDVACWLFELDTEKLLPYCPPRLLFTGLARFPAVARDMAVVVDADFASERVLQFVRQWRPEVVEDIVMFDAYTGASVPAGKKSLAYTISYRAADRTLTDDEVNALHAELVRSLSRQLGVELRQ